MNEEPETVHERPQAQQPAADDHPAGKITALRYSKVGARTIALAGLAMTAWQAAGAPTHTASSWN